MGVIADLSSQSSGPTPQMMSSSSSARCTADSPKKTRRLRQSEWETIVRSDCSGSGLTVFTRSPALSSRTPLWVVVVAVNSRSRPS